jgi:hypothetical protein
MTSIEKTLLITSPRFPGWGTERDLADAIQRATGCDPLNAERAADDVVKLLADRGIEVK